MISSVPISRTEREVMTAEDSSPAELEQVCGSVVSEALRSSLESAPRSVKFRGSSGNPAVKDLIRRFIGGDM